MASEDLITSVLWVQEFTDPNSPLILQTIKSWLAILGTTFVFDMPENSTTGAL
jgi:hypothetical protein